jgi:hypothetical protein
MPAQEVAKTYEMHVLPQGEDGYGLALYQPALRGSERRGATDEGEQTSSPRPSTPDTACTKVVQVWGTPLKAVLEPVLTTVKRAGYKATDLHRGRKAPFRLSEEDGVRLGLLFLAVKPLHKLARIEAVSERIRRREPEELYYWFSKSTSTTEGHRALRALRILIAEE